MVKYFVLDTQYENIVTIKVCGKKYYPKPFNVICFDTKKGVGEIRSWSTGTRIKFADEGHILRAPVYRFGAPYYKEITRPHNWPENIKHFVNN